MVKSTTENLAEAYWKVWVLLCETQNITRFNNLKEYLNLLNSAFGKF